MGSLRRFLRLPKAERGLLFRAAFLLCAVQLGLWLLPRRTLQKMLPPPSNHPVASPRAACSPAMIAQAVATASRFVPGARRCLTRALAAHLLLLQHGYQASLRIGVARGEADQFQAHAWVEGQGEVLMGGPEVTRYVALPRWERS